LITCQFLWECRLASQPFINLSKFWAIFWVYEHYPSLFKTPGWVPHHSSFQLYRKKIL
jgi:hypothetical protein